MKRQKVCLIVNNLANTESVNVLIGSTRKKTRTAICGGVHMETISSHITKNTNRQVKMQKESATEKHDMQKEATMVEMEKKEEMQENPVNYMYPIYENKVTKRQMARFLSQRRSKIIVTKEKERIKRNGEEKERRRREKNNGCTLSFYNSYFRFWLKKTVRHKRSIGR